MKVFIVHAHPDPRSFNSSLTTLAQEALAQEGHEVVISDLYAMDFQPVFNEQDSPAADVQNELEKLFWCDVLILQFPLWWCSLPAILKGWVDRVFVVGKVHSADKWYDDGAMQGRRALLSLTTDSSATSHSPTGLNGEINQMLFPINHGILRYVGFDVLPPFVAWELAQTDDAQRKAYLEEYRQRLLTLQTTRPIAYPPLVDYDPHTLQLSRRRDTTA